MVTDSVFVWIVVGILIIIFLYALYYISKLVKKKPVTTVTSELEPQITVTDTDNNVEPSHLTKVDVEGEPLESQIELDVKEPSPIRERGSKIIDIEGIGPVYAEKLNSINVYTTSDLLGAGATPHGRKELAEKTGIQPKLILEWVNLADLFRIKGVGEEYSDLLEEAGVDTVVELSHRNAVNLHARLLEVNEDKKLVRRPPTLAMVESWVKEANTLPRKIEY